LTGDYHKSAHVTRPRVFARCFEVLKPAARTRSREPRFATAAGHSEAQDPTPQVDTSGPSILGRAVPSVAKPTQNLRPSRNANSFLQTFRLNARGWSSKKIRPRLARKSDCRKRSDRGWPESRIVTQRCQPSDR